ncbi:uncharacterized protein IWZ02DRAFT_434407 [Phyllosticta citriasiana]|uniref:uncharacterized protein n=1 Tax=Phyllosticta citriasiana TaxID=595635 RepID=UPI0030FD4F4A
MHPAGSFLPSFLPSFLCPAALLACLLACFLAYLVLLACLSALGSCLLHAASTTYASTPQSIISSLGRLLSQRGNVLAAIHHQTSRATNSNQGTHGPRPALVPKRAKLDVWANEMNSTPAHARSWVFIRASAAPISVRKGLGETESTALDDDMEWQFLNETELSN